jgi:hypothetical protein
MKKHKTKLICILTFVWISLCNPAAAKLEFVPEPLDSGVMLLIVKGEFTAIDQTDDFRRAALEYKATHILFDSPGGNVASAIALGRTIRALGLSTIQTRSFECASACAFAFAGGKARSALTGSIGMHRATLTEGLDITPDDAVEIVQSTTAQIMLYLNEMGVDPGVMTIALAYDAKDMRYFSLSEMEQYRLVTVQQFGTESGSDLSSAVPLTVKPSTTPTEQNLPAASSPTTSNPSKQTTTTATVQDSPLVSEPSPSTSSSGLTKASEIIGVGVVRHPEGEAQLMAAANDKSNVIASFPNRTDVRILASKDRWFSVSVKGANGWMHHNWVKVDGFAESPFESRRIQIRSFGTLDEVRAFLATNRFALDVYLASNGLYAVTLDGVFERQVALDIVGNLKANGSIPDDSMVTFGNTYVEKVCCD